MDISNLLSRHNSSIVPPRLDPLFGSLGLLPSFNNLTFLDKIVLRDTCWRLQVRLFTCFRGEHSARA